MSSRVLQAEMKDRDLFSIDCGLQEQQLTSKESALK